VIPCGRHENVSHLEADILDVRFYFQSANRQAKAACHAVKSKVCTLADKSCGTVGRSTFPLADDIPKVLS
jgi:hypothetical protein